MQRFPPSPHRGHVVSNEAKGSSSAMSTLQIATNLVLLGAVLVVLAYDLVIAVRGDWSATTSYSLYTLARTAPIVPFLMGVFVGHCLWPLAKDVTPAQTPAATRPETPPGTAPNPSAGGTPDTPPPTTPPR